MEMKKAQKLRRIYGAALGALTAVSGILFLIQTLTIYFSGADKPYSREVVAAKLAQIQIPLWIWVAAVVAGGILCYAFPDAKEKPVAPKDDEKTLSRLKKRLPEKLTDEYAPLFRSVQKEEKKRKNIRYACAGVCLVCALFGALYLLNPKNFPAENLNAEVIAMVAHVLPFVAVSFLAACVGAILVNRSAAKELEQVKTLVSAGAKQKAKPAAAQEQTNPFAPLYTEKTRLIARLCLLAVGVAFVVWGVFNGGATDVLTKAVNICTECIGLG